MTLLPITTAPERMAFLSNFEGEVFDHGRIDCQEAPTSAGHLGNRGSSRPIDRIRKKIGLSVVFTLSRLIRSVAGAICGEVVFVDSLLSRNPQVTDKQVEQLQRTPSDQFYCLDFEPSSTQEMLSSANGHLHA